MKRIQENLQLDAQRELDERQEKKELLRKIMRENMENKKIKLMAEEKEK